MCDELTSLKSYDSVLTLHIRLEDIFPPEFSFYQMLIRKSKYSIF